MSLVINTNINSLMAQRNLATNQSSLQTAMQRLSSGLRINSAADDPAGLAIAARMTSQINGMDQASMNANNAISMAQTADGALGSASDMLQQIRSLAVESANATNSSSDRQALNAEVGQLSTELNQIAQTTQFNGQNLFDGSFGAATFQIGANANQTITTSIPNLLTNNYGNNEIGATGVDSGVAAAAAAWGANGVAAGNLVINGSTGTATIGVVANATVMSTAALVNAQTATTGVTASAQAQLNMNGFTAAGNYSITLQSDNTTAQTITFSLSATTGASNFASAANAINAQTSKTGVTAAVNSTGDGLILSNSDGNDIALTSGASSAGSFNVTKQDNAGTASGAAQTVAASGNAIVSGVLTLDSQNSFAVTDASNSLVTAGGAASSAQQTVSSLDVTSVTNATAAIKIVDAALNVINSQRAQFGALEQRFTQVVSNLTTNSTNLSSARSGIQDANFAAETASLSRAQILQQAGTAMVAQANQGGQGVLALLR